MYLGAFATAGNLSSSSVSVNMSFDFPFCFDFAFLFDFAGSFDCAGCFDLDRVRRLVRVETFDFGETLNVDDLDFGDTLNFRLFGLVRPDSFMLELPDIVRFLPGRIWGGVRMPGCLPA
jgi:hypothetical protein